MINLESGGIPLLIHKVKTKLVFLFFIAFIFSNSCFSVDKFTLIHSDQIMKQLKIGLSKESVKKILGIADYSPIEGLYYYALKNTKTLVLDYRTKKSKIATQLQSFWIEENCE